MKRQRTNSDDSGRLAVLHRAGRHWRALVAETDGRKPEVIATREFTDETAKTIEPWLDEQQVTQILCVLPASSYICRTCTLPDVPPDAIEQALDLQVEAHLPDVVPGYRIGAAALDTATGEASRSGMLIAWPESSHFVAPIDDDRVRYVPDVAALAALMNGERPADPLMALDPTAGSIAIALTHANGAVFRAAQDSGDSTISWGDTVGRTLAETALSVNHTGPFVESIVNMAKAAVRQSGDGEPALMVPSETRDSARRRISGASLEESWWGKFGVAVGALLARTGELHGVTQLELAPPLESPSRVDALVHALARPRMAVYCAIACLMLLAFGPLLLHGTRVAVLKMRHGDLAARMADYDQLMAKRDMYQDLQRESWPLTKLIADLTTNTPPGIELDSLSFGDGSFMAAGMAIPFNYPAEPDEDKWTKNYPAGRQDAKSNIAIMDRNLTASNIFQQPKFTMRPPNAFGHVEFTITATIDEPFFERQYPVDWDFAKWTMQQRIDEVGPGEKKYPDASATSSARSESDSIPGTSLTQNTTESNTGSGAFLSEPAMEIGDTPTELLAGGADPDQPSGGRTPRTNGSGGRSSRPPTTSGSSNGEGVNRSEVGARSETGVGPVFEVPETLTQEQINTMDRAQVLAILTKVAEAKNAVRGKDEELYKQLDAQWKMLFARLNAIGPEQ